MFHKLRTYLRTSQSDIWNHNHKIKTNGSLTLKIQGSYGFLLCIYCVLSCMHGSKATEIWPG